MDEELKQRLIPFLGRQHLCASLTVREVETFLDFTDLVRFRKGEVIAEVGEVGEALYVVLRGEVGFHYDNAGRELEVGVAREGELVGEMSFFDRRPRSLRIRAKAPRTELLRLSRPMYQRLKVERPFIAVNLLEQAIISLDRLLRQVSAEEASLAHYVYGPGRR